MPKSYFHFESRQIIFAIIYLKVFVLLDGSYLHRLTVFAEAEEVDYADLIVCDPKRGFDHR